MPTNIVTNLSGMTNEAIQAVVKTTVDRTPFYVFLIILGGILAFMLLRNFFVWYFKTNEIKEMLNEVIDRLDRLEKGGPKTAQKLPSESALLQPKASDDAEIAAVIAAVKLLVK